MTNHCKTFTSDTMMIVSNSRESFGNHDTHEEYSCLMSRSVIKEEEILTDTSSDSDDQPDKENFHSPKSQVSLDKVKAVKSNPDIHIKTSQLGTSPKKKNEIRSEASKRFLAKSLLNLIIKNTRPSIENVTLDDDLSSSDSDENRERAPVITMSRVNKIILIDTKLRQETRVELPRLTIHDSMSTVDTISISPEKSLTLKTEEVKTTALKSPQKLPYLEIKDKRAILEFPQKLLTSDISDESPVSKLAEMPPPPLKRKRGRPPKYPRKLPIPEITDQGIILQSSLTAPPLKRKRGRPRKSEIILHKAQSPIMKNVKKLSSKSLQELSPKRLKIKRIQARRSKPEKYIKDPDTLALMLIQCSSCKNIHPRGPYTRKPASCEKCGHSPLSWMCGKCGRLDDSWYRAYRHLTHTCVNRKRYNCDHCGVGIRDKGHLRKHIWELHMGLSSGRNKKPTSGPQCDNCGKFFSAVYNLNSHRQRCGREPTHACPDCDFRSKTTGDLDKHRWRRHAEIYGGLQFKCDVCGKKYGREDALKKHKSHFCGKQERYHCTWCKKEFRYKRQLVEHITIAGC